MSDYSELLELAEAAGLVDWKWWTSNSFLRLTTESNGRHGADGDAISAYRDNVQCPEAYRALIEKASPAAIGELITRNKELADEVIVVEFQKKILGEGLRKDRAEIAELKAEIERLRTAEGDAMTYKAGMENVAQQRDQLKQENRLLTEHNEFLASSDSRLAPELRAVKDALGLDFTASVIGEVVPAIEKLRKDAERYRFLCDKFGVTDLPCALERILPGDLYVADGKPSIDSVIDAARAKAQ